MLIKKFEDPRLRLLISRYVRLAPGQWDYVNVSRPFWMLYWNNKPGAVIYHARQRIELKPSRVVLIAPHTIVSTSSSVCVYHLHVHFQILAFYLGVMPQVSVFTMTPALRDLIQELLRLLQTRRHSTWHLSLVTRALAELAVSKLIDKRIRIPQLDARLLPALDYLDENLAGDTSNTALAQRVGMSNSTFKRLFRAQMGRSPHAYLRLKRVEKACMMLLDDVSIKQVAEATGFCDRYHFSRIFKRIQHIVPSEYRRQTCNFVVAPHVQDQIAGRTRR